MIANKSVSFVQISEEEDEETSSEYIHHPDTILQKRIESLAKYIDKIEEEFYDQEISLDYLEAELYCLETSDVVLELPGQSSA